MAKKTLDQIVKEAKGVLEETVEQPPKTPPPPPPRVPAPAGRPGLLPGQVDVQNLETGKTYILTMRMPLMPKFDAMHLAKGDRKIMLPWRAHIKVLQRKMKRLCPWYRVESKVKMGKNAKAKKVQGWINSIAMINVGIRLAD